MEEKILPKLVFSVRLIVRSSDSLLVRLWCCNDVCDEFRDWDECIIRVKRSLSDFKAHISFCNKEQNTSYTQKLPGIYCTNSNIQIIAMLNISKPPENAALLRLKLFVHQTIMKSPHYTNPPPKKPQLHIIGDSKNDFKHITGMKDNLILSTAQKSSQ